MKAWIVRCTGEQFGEMVVWHETRSKARWECVRTLCEFWDYSAKEALSILRLSRAPWFDKHKDAGPGVTLSHESMGIGK